MPYPYQCLLYCCRPGQAEAGTLVAASGPYIHTFSFQHSTYLSSWPLSQDLENSSQEQGSKPSLQDLEETKPILQDSQRPGKRRKLSPSRADSGSSAEIVVNGADASCPNSKTEPAVSAPVIKLARTSIGQYVVAITDEDKCIRVFKLLENGILTQHSERVMPKRPCAVVLTPDDSTILCADKFGDVYSLPLLGQTYQPIAGGSGAKPDPVAGMIESSHKALSPSATSLTVHTKGNLEALRQQQRIKNFKAEKKSLNFDHQLLLGHVSLLTDLACISIPSSSNNMRNYILTSDRDEHIRVSRGIPQAYIIEGYCLGHTEFISKLCIPAAYPHMLISGGGDEFLLLWDWQLGKILQKIALKCHVEAFKKQHGADQASALATDANQEADHRKDTKNSLAVSNIRHYNGTRADENGSLVVVTCEGVPALFYFHMAIDAASMSYLGTSPLLEGNVIDILVMQDQGTIVYSMDTVHEPFSTTRLRSDQMQGKRPSVGVMKIGPDITMSQMTVEQNSKLVKAMEQCIEAHPIVQHNVMMRGRSMRDLLYGLESLRKRNGEEHND